MAAAANFVSFDVTAGNNFSCFFFQLFGTVHARETGCVAFNCNTFTWILFFFFLQLVKCTEQRYSCFSVVLWFIPWFSPSSYVICVDNSIIVKPWRWLQPKSLATAPLSNSIALLPVAVLRQYDIGWELRRMENSLHRKCSHNISIIAAIKSPYCTYLMAHNKHKTLLCNNHK